MVKGSTKSSATSGTRKKHARKLAGPPVPVEPHPKKEKGKKGNKKEPKLKQYIPPVKPAPVQPDPLETTGLARRLRPELLVVLRSLGKKAAVTKSRALEELQGWFDQDEEEVEQLVEVVPVWMHHLPALFIHPSRRVRQLTAGLHNLFLRLPATRFYLAETASPDQVENVLGSWLLAAHDIDRNVASAALLSWQSLVQSDYSLDKPALVTSTQRAILDPQGVYTYLNPPAPVAPPPPSRGKRPPISDPEPTARSKSDELEEDEQDRKARIRIGGLGSLRWLTEATSEPSDDLLGALNNLALWSSLHPSFACPYSEETFGHGQPLVRRAAWGLVQSLLVTWKGKLDAILPILSTSILRSAWIEGDMGVLGVMWGPLLVFLKEYPSAWELAAAFQTLDGADSEDEEEITDLPSSSSAGAYQEFLQFLSLGCSGAALQGYPTIVVVLSTIPSSVFSSSSATPLKHFLACFWAAVYSKALRPTHFIAFLSSLLECLLFLLRRIQRGHGETILGCENRVQDVLKEEFERIWREVSGGMGKGKVTNVGPLLGRTLGAIGEIETEWFDVAWEAFAEGMKQDVRVAPGFLRTFVSGEDQRVKEAAREVVKEVLDVGLGDQAMDVLVEMLYVFGKDLFVDDVYEQFVERLDVALQTSSNLQLVLAYLRHRGDEEKCLQLWRQILRSIAGEPDRLRPLVDAIRHGLLPSYLKPDPAGNPLDEYIGTRTTIGKDVLGEGVWKYFLSPSSFASIVESIVQGFRADVNAALRSPSPTPSLSLELMNQVKQSIGKQGLASVFVAGYVLDWDTARTIWDGTADEEVKGELKTLLRDPSVLVPVETVLASLSHVPSVRPMDTLPSEEEFDLLLSYLPTDPTDPSIGVLDPFIPATSPSLRSLHADEYTRLTKALVAVFSSDRHMAKENSWGLRHLLAASIFAEDLLALNQVADGAFVDAVKRISTYQLMGIEKEERKKALGARGTGFLADVLRYSRESDTVLETRILRKVLARVLLDDEIDMEEVDMWVAFARGCEKQSPETTISVLSSLMTCRVPETAKLDRYRNELAASLPSKTPLLTLRKLVAAAPDPESDVVFLSGPRAVNVIKACRSIIEDDESDEEEEVEGVLVQLFAYLAPILQGIPGGHWDFILDVVESNLENCSLDETDTLPTLVHTLKLIVVVRDLAMRNKALRDEYWKAREKGILKAVMELVAAEIAPDQSTTPKSICRELMLEIVKDLPEALVETTMISKMCHLLTDTSVDVQKMAYHLLEQGARKRTEHLVIEAGVDAGEGGEFKAELPLELVKMLGIVIVGNEAEQIVFGYLLSWMVAFDLFQGASLKVRLSYIDQLRSHGLILDCFVPSILALLRVDEGIGKAVKLDGWAVDEFAVQLYDPETTFALQLLSAHVYYRALLTVPSMIHSWVLDCKDRQVSSSIVTYTSTYFSPYIIRQELSHVRMSSPADGDMSVKVASAVNEVIASYTVDEHQLEIKFKIPLDWPLHKIEIREMNRVGVGESRWRAWILAVQQTIWAQNGRITDGLELFKKNVMLHFEGRAECAICYSIISVMDGSLPKKPCKTCKNRFHASCLYKWFHTSHSSSCPLCRSDIL